MATGSLATLGVSEDTRSLYRPVVAFLCFCPGLVQHVRGGPDVLSILRQEFLSEILDMRLQAQGFGLFLGHRVSAAKVALDSRKVEAELGSFGHSAARVAVDLPQVASGSPDPDLQRRSIPFYKVLQLLPSRCVLVSLHHR